MSNALFAKAKFFRLDQFVMLLYLNLPFLSRKTQDGGKQLQEGMEENDTITHMDLRLTECGQESEYCINQILSKNREKEREMKLKEINAA